MNKKGEEEEILMGETINIIVAVLCIVALIALVVVIYLTTTANNGARYAAAIVNGNNGIANETKVINAGGADNTNFFVPNPSGWYIFSFTEESIRPNKCSGGNCLCICEKLLVGIINTDSRQAGKCDDTGSCVVIQNLKTFDKIQIKNGGIFISIKKVNGMVEVTKND